MDSRFMCVAALRVMETEWLQRRLQPVVSLFGAEQGAVCVTVCQLGHGAAGQVQPAKRADLLTSTIHPANSHPVRVKLT